MAARDWYAWHGRYDDPASDLSRRLQAVQRRIIEALDQARPGPIRAVSICAGQGRDLLGVMARHARARDVVAQLVELDPRNAEVASSAARAGGMEGVEVVVGDASRADAYLGAVPADLVIACGVLGHVVDGEIPAAIDALRSLCAEGATVVWTRGGDLRPTVRRWFIDGGFDEVGYESGGERGWGVGAARLRDGPLALRPGVPLFTFHDERPVADESRP